MISVDAKRKELVGKFKNNGRERQPAGEPEEVNVHDFPDKELGKAIPYGIYDLSANAGWVSVGTDHDTSAFAVATLRTWWDTIGRTRYPTADRLLICADDGGSNGHRVRAWKTGGGRYKTHQIIVDLISHTTTATGLVVQAMLDTSEYPIDIRYTDKDVAALPLVRHEFHGDCAN